jgi:hypothetical protein
VIEIERERDHLAFAHQPGGRNDVFGARIVEGTDLVVRAPFAPVLVLFRRVTEILPRQLPRRHCTILF